MAIIPKQQNKLESAKDIEENARRLLRAASVGERLPTPQDDILSCAELVISGEIDLIDYKRSFISKASNALISGLGKLLGFLDFREKVITISPDLSEARRPFVTFHEVSHNMLPWQVAAYDYFADSNETLRPDIEAKFEREANYGSAQLLFQCGRLEKEARDLELSLRTGIKLKADYGASFHSTFWNYVATNREPCLLLILKRCQYTELINGKMVCPYELLYTVASKKFIEEFGGMSLHDKFYSDHPFTNFLNDPLVPVSYVHPGEIALKNINCDKVECQFEAWSNSYNLFVLLWKKPTRRLRRKRILFQEVT